MKIRITKEINKLEDKAHLASDVCPEIQRGEESKQRKCLGKDPSWHLREGLRCNECQ